MSVTAEAGEDKGEAVVTTADCVDEDGVRVGALARDAEGAYQVAACLP